MKIVIAPDSFKESLSSTEVADNIAAGIRKILSSVKIQKIPLADGGEGTLDILLKSTRGKQIKCYVTGPLGNKFYARYGVLGDKKTAVVEMATASGLVLVPPKKRNPMKTTTYGTGELIKSALNKGYRKIVVGIGGSATVDGGVGMAQALGIRFRDKQGKEIGLGGGELEKICSVDITQIDKRIKNTEFVVACDVKNLLLGNNGAVKVYGPQKGATSEMVNRLEAGLTNLTRVVKKDLGIGINKIVGGGAAGGLGAGLVMFLNAKIVSGIELVIKLTGLEQYIKSADLVITGEGRIDSQTVYGKTIMGVVSLAKKYSVPVVCFAGSVTPESKVLYKYGVIGFVDIVPYPMSLNEAITNAKELLVDASENFARMMLRTIISNE